MSRLTNPEIAHEVVDVTHPLNNPSFEDIACRNEAIITGTHLLDELDMMTATFGTEDHDNSEKNGE